jgi:hypothetical protein
MRSESFSITARISLPNVVIEIDGCDVLVVRGPKV